MDHQQENDKTERRTGPDTGQRKEITENENKMTAMRFQTGGTLYI